MDATQVPILVIIMHLVNHWTAKEKEPVKKPAIVQQEIIYPALEENNVLVERNRP